MLARMVNGLATVAGAAAGAQFPAFYAHYVQEIGARIRQAADGLTAIRSLAEAQGVPIYEILARLRTKGPVGEAAYEDLHGTYLVLQRLEPAYTALTDAGALERPFVFARHFHADLAAGTLENFAPALPLSAAGAAYAICGLVLALALAWSVQRMCILAVKRVAGRAKRESTEQNA